MTAVLDTNVLVSALWSPQGSPAQVVTAAYAGSFDPVVSEDIMDEYFRVLTSRELSLPVPAVREMLAWFRQFLLPLPPPLAPHRCHDPGDQKLLDAALAAQAALLVTGNRRHFPAHVPHVAIVSPAEALHRIRLPRTMSDDR